jgi:Holliday junction resolvase RusA-like endonuclease
VSVRRRTWTGPNGETKEAWIVDYRDQYRKRRLRTFRTKADAIRFSGVSTAVRAGIIPEPLTAKQFSPVEFIVPLPENRWIRNGPGRDTLVAALRSACPMAQPTIDSVVMHLIVELPPRAVIADVDNLLKPVLDALKGITWVDDNQICELLVRRVPGRTRQLRIRLWQLPQTAITPHLNALMREGLILDWRR